MDSWLGGLPQQVNSSVLGYPVLGCDADLPVLREECPAAVLAIGQLPDSATRVRLAKQLKRRFSSTCSDFSLRSSDHAQLGSGTTVGHGAIVNAGAVVGDTVLLILVP